MLHNYYTMLSTLHTYSNLDHNTGRAQHTVSLSADAGQKITLKFTGREDYELQTSFVTDDTAINVSQRQICDSADLTAQVNENGRPGGVTGRPPLQVRTSRTMSRGTGGNHDQQDKSPGSRRD